MSNETNKTTPELITELVNIITPIAVAAIARHLQSKNMTVEELNDAASKNWQQAILETEPNERQ